MPTNPPEYYRSWYEKNKEKHLARMLERVICECGMEIPRNYATRHRAGKRHNQLMNSKSKMHCKGCKCEGKEEDPHCDDCSC